MSKKIKWYFTTCKIETNNIYIDSISSLPSKHFDIIIDCINSVEGKTIPLFLKSRGDNSVFVTACGSGFHLDSTKFVYGKLSEASDKLASNFKSR